MLLFILRNIIHNSIKYCDTKDQIQISTKLEHGIQHIAIKDTGKGMKQEVCDNIHKLCSEPSRPGTRDEVGSGLGLLLVKEFIELNNGSIRISSKENAGTLVVVSLPLKKN